VIPISRQSFGEEGEQAVLDVMRSGQLAQEERVRRFEDACARATGAGCSGSHLQWQLGARALGLRTPSGVVGGLTSGSEPRRVLVPALQMSPELPRNTQLDCGA